MRRVRPLRAALAAVVLLSLGWPSSASAQRVTQPGQPWRTFRTAHFDFHAPATLEAWTRHVASRMESYAAAVSAAVGNSPASRVTVIVEDPTGDANGYAVPLLDRPVIVLWPTPPTPSLTFGEHRGWGEILALHEYAHIAHLTYVSRNPRERFWWSLLPARVGPVAMKAPPWVFEGYATLIEGRLTGAGRPHSAARAAILREWAVSGKLPSFSALDETRTFLGGAMRYLVGSAFLEWLAERKGDASLEHVWRRLSAREPRSFAAAFAGVYGASPADLYGEFVVQVTERALLARKTVDEAGVREGELVQRLFWSTGEPAVSPDGTRVALVLRQPNVPSRLVVWRTGPGGVDSTLLRRRARTLARDPLDVAPFDSFPLPRRAEATLRAAFGAGYNNPRWLPDGTHILVSREMPLGNGASRPDLFLWNWQAGSIRRVTRGAATRSADPSPDGARAAAVRCAAGRCGLILVTLADGTWRELMPGTFALSWHRPRWSRDGRRIAASVQRDGRWQIGIVDVPSGHVTFVTPNDSASQHSPVWVGGDLLVVSDRSGIPNLELIAIDSGTPRAVTNVVSAVTAPDYSLQDQTAWYLDLHPTGLDVRRLSLHMRHERQAANLPATLHPAAPIPRAPGPSFDSMDVAPRGYGVGPRDWRYLPGFGAGADGSYALLALTNYDPAGKLALLAQGAYGQRRVWRGGSLGIAWRGWRAFDVETQGFTAQFGAARGSENPRFTGGALSIGRVLDYGSTAWSWQFGASRAELRLSDSTAVDRSHADVEVTYALRRSLGLWRAIQLRAYASAGETGDVDVRRSIASLGITAALGALRLRLSASGGTTELEPDSLSAAASFEVFSIGGLAPPLFDDRVVPQRISSAALPAGSASGRSFAAYRAALSHAGLPASLYAAWFKVYDPNGNWQRFVGFEGGQTFETIGFASLPNVALYYGAAYSIDHPRRHRWTLYGGARFAP
ncbi:MAG: TolB family protein [Gemmatimonadaceae bacterium]